MSDTATRIAEAAAIKPTDDDTPKTNPYLEVVHKRMRALRKRLQKIELNEEKKKKNEPLNEEQLESIRRKGEVELMLKDLEEIYKQLLNVENEELKAQKKQLKRQKAEELKQQQQNRQRLEETVQEVTKVLYLLFQFGEDAVRQYFLNGSEPTLTFAQAQLDDLDQLQEILYPKFDKDVGLNSISKSAAEILLHIVEGTPFSVSNISAEKLQQLFQSITKTAYFDAETAARIAAEAERAAREAEEEAIRAAIHAEYIVIDPEDVPELNVDSPEQRNGLPNFEFMVESEIYIEEETPLVEYLPPGNMEISSPDVGIVTEVTASTTTTTSIISMTENGITIEKKTVTTSSDAASVKTSIIDASDYEPEYLDDEPVPQPEEWQHSGRRGGRRGHANTHDGGNRGGRGGHRYNNKNNANGDNYQRDGYHRGNRDQQQQQQGKGEQRSQPRRSNNKDNNNNNGERRQYNNRQHHNKQGGGGDRQQQQQQQQGTAQQSNK